MRTRPVGPLASRIFCPRHTVAAVLASLVGSVSMPARAADVYADPSNYTQMLGTLKPGDILHLAAGTYAPTGSTPLPLSNLNGTSSQWITVTGPPAFPPTAVFRASPDGCCNIVEITNSSYLAIENLYVDGNHISGEFGISAKGGTSNLVHDIRVDGNRFVNIDNDGDPADLGQQDDAISTKAPTWGWVIHRNSIIGAGTGMYLGNSDGSDPFVEGIIDDNLVDSPTGYCIEVKQQNPWPTVAGMPTQPTATLISNNVFIKKDHAATTSGGRPQVLVDGFPTTGSGGQNHYEIYGNLFFHDDDDFLLQATGRVHVHDNIFIDDSMYGGVNFTDHDGHTVIDAIAYNNTVYGVGTGISFSSVPSGVGFAVGNAIFAATAFSGAVASQVDNATDTVANAGNYVVSPGLALGTTDFYPKTGSGLHGAVMDLSSVSTDVDYDLDFNGTTKDFTYRGAYSGQGANPGWPLGDGVKDGGSGSDAGGDAGGHAGGDAGGDAGGHAGGDAGGDAGGGSRDGGDSGSGRRVGGDSGGRGVSGGDGGAAGEAPGSSSGCGCRASGVAPTGPSAGLMIAGLVLACARRRKRY
jgi:MYXO-CTERM domain-containing protein